MITIRSFLPTLALVATVFTGCAAETAPAVESVEGLSLTSNTAELVSGEFRRHDTRIVFESAKVTSGSYVRVAALDGTELLRITSDEVKTTTSIMDRKLVVTVAREGSSTPPSVEGDVTAAEALKARPEFALVTELSKALEEAGVSSSLIEPVVGTKRINQDEVPEQESGGVPKKSGCSTWEKIGCAAWITTCSAGCAVGTAGTALPLCIAACVATTAAGCLKCL